MIEIKKIYKKDIPGLLRDDSFWNHGFLSVSKHRLLAHLRNPGSDDNDIVLLLAYLNQELVGYMGVFTDKIVLDGNEQKIGWLSTWWVHPKTKGSGIGREILDTMYAANDGKIGISQFTPSAKRVYDKSGYFYNLKENHGIKAVLRSNLAFVVPATFPKLKPLQSLFNGLDHFANFFINMRLEFQKIFVRKKLKNTSVEYLNAIDADTRRLIQKHSHNHISKKTDAFFEWLKAYYWVQDAPLLSLTKKSRYEFSMCDKGFNIYFIKILENDICKGFAVLQKRNHVCKILFAYFDQADAAVVSNVIKLQCTEQNVREIICYDEAITANFRRSFLFLYKTRKVKHSIISKAFNKENFDDIVMNFGDGDCSFA